MDSIAQLNNFSDIDAKKMEFNSFIEDNTPAFVRMSIIVEMHGCFFVEPSPVGRFCNFL